MLSPTRGDGRRYFARSWLSIVACLALSTGALQLRAETTEVPAVRPSLGIFTAPFNAPTYFFNVSYTGGERNRLVLANIQTIESLVVTTAVDEDDGTSDATVGAGTSLREAIAYANTLSGPHTITFSNSTANGATNFNDNVFRTIVLGGTELLIDSDLTIVGPLTHALAISGNNVSRIFNVGSKNQAAQVSISRMTLTGGASPGDGGAITNIAFLTLSHMVLSGNSSGNNNGGAIRNNGSLIVNASTVSGNTTNNNGEGGAIFTIGSCTISQSTISGNSSFNGDGGAVWNNGILAVNASTVSLNTTHGGDGGAIFNLGECTISQSTISDNSSDNGDGGAIWNDSSLSVNASIVSVNTTASGDGAAIYNASFCTISQSTISDNSSTNGDGGAVFNNNILILNQSTMTGNSTTSGDGGAIFNNDTMNIIASTISGNSSVNGAGGAIFNNDTLTLNHSTFAANTTTNGDGGALFNNGTVKATALTIVGNQSTFGQGGGIQNSSNPLSIGSSIIANNLAFKDRDVSGVVASQGFLLIGNTLGSSGYVASDLLNIQPLLAPLANYGGPTNTLSLLPGSPAINAGGTAVSSEQQQLVVTGSVGAYSLTFKGQTTVSISTNSDAQQVQSALQALPTIGSGNILVSGDRTGSRFTLWVR